MPHERVARIFSRTAIDSPDRFGMENGVGDSRSGSRGANSQVRYNTGFEEESKTTFTKQRGCFVSWWRGALIVVAVVGALLLVGLLVGYLAPCHRKDQNLNLDRITAQRHTSKRHGKSRSLKDDTKTKSSNDIGTSAEESVRLPRGIKPLSYNLRLQPHLPPENFTVDGFVEIRVECKEATDSITLHKNQLEVTFVNLTGEGVAVPPILNTTFDPEKQFFIIKLNGHLHPGHQYIIALEFNGEINNQSVGLYRSSYVDSNGQRRWLAVSQMQPTDARRVFPCFDEPALKATFDVSIIRKKNVISLSNMPVWKTEPWNDEWEVDLYNSTVPMSTYLLAFVIGDVVPFEKGSFQVWSRPSAIEFAEYAQSTGPALLAFYEDFFGVPYPLPKTDMVAVPDFLFAAMENWGLIIYEESALLYDPERSSSEDQVFVTVVVAHELAHQWFGNLVTMKWWDDLWLNEGFATYVEYLGADAVQPEWGMNQQFLMDVYEVMETDCLTSSHPVSVEVTDPDEITELFDDISYLKGGAIIRMMEHFLGNDNFRNGLKNYLEAFSYKSATQDDLWHFLNKSSKGEVDVKEVMDNWTLQTGYPVVTLRRSNDSKTVTITQSRFLLDAENSTDEEDNEDNSALWSIPLTYTDASDLNWTTTTRDWLTTESKELHDLPDHDDWVIVNIQQVGYYRVNYDLDNWERLILQLQFDHEVIHVINRGQILNDALNLARSGDLLYPLALNLTLYLYQEKDFLPWQATLVAFRYMDLMLAKTPAYGMWKDYVLLLMSPVYSVLGWTESDPSEEMLTRFLRSTILKWTCNYGSVECVGSARNTFEKWKKKPDDSEIIPADVREVVLCTGIEYGSSKDWEFVWTRYLKEDLKTEKNVLLKALACSREPWLLERYLNWALKPESGIKLQDGSSVFAYVANNVYGRDIVYNFFRKNWNTIFNIVQWRRETFLLKAGKLSLNNILARRMPLVLIFVYGSAIGGMAEIVEHVTAPLNSEYEVQELRSFLKQRTDRLGTATAALHQAVERSKANVRWMAKNFDVIGNWLEGRIPESP